MRHGRTVHNPIRYCRLFGMAAFLLACPWLQGRAVAGNLYDQPLEVRHVDLKPDPLNPQVKRSVFCFRYKHFVIKQVDFGEVGADRLSILPAGPGKKMQCRQAKERDEYVIPADSWSGYFEGVKSDYAFFTAADGTNGGLGFMVFSTADRKKLFEDTAEKGIQAIEIKDRDVRLRYQRVFASKCSVVTEGLACQDRIVKETGVSSGSFSSCAGSYEASKQEMAKMRCESQTAADSSCMEKELKIINEQKWDAAPTVIVYEAEAALGGKSPVIKPLSDVSACRPSD